MNEEIIRTLTDSTEPAGEPNAGAEMPSFDDMLRSGYQAEFDRRVSKAIETARSKFVDPAVEQLRQQLEGYIRRETAVRAGVAPLFLRFVVSEVGEMGGDFEQNLSAFLAANPQFKQPAEPQAFGWGQRGIGGGESAPDGVEAAFRRNNPNLKI